MNTSDGEILEQICQTAFMKDFQVPHFDVVDRHYDYKKLEWICRDTFNEDFEIPSFDLETPRSTPEPTMKASRAGADVDTTKPNPEEAQYTTPLFTLPPELRLQIYTYILSPLRVSPTITTCRFPLIQTCRLIRYEAKTVYFARLDEIDREARKRYQERVVRFERGVDGEEIRAGDRMIQSWVLMRDVVRLTGEMRGASFGQGGEEKESDERGGEGRSVLRDVVREWVVIVVVDWVLWEVLGIC
ncbi:hypothetical protein M409DRAFT_27969 [Zasmidium cellare ATCC 36951]|uniref:F-box domain-containing protein n=1 Tax=Zasmidium cellare ATCC 36951 TaxID=1080233 RepID=A0A6A6C394_ZASCE|nr:uncharacterized protein M409DRAFT_27969 [Zasmidium cellare ATCC 36951]KAF2161574.1 hypothetical protein M409DRAFT_27969 [Zasmidium cellare ATCC 36951]